jgi:hypothetical protein
MNEITTKRITTATQPSRRAAARSAIIAHHEVIRWRRLVKSPLGFSRGRAAVTATAKVSTPSTPPRPQSRLRG